MFKSSKLSLVATVVVIALSSSNSARADFNEIPLDKSDNQSPVLISATLEKISAPAGSANSIVITILDDKNAMRVATYELAAPSGTGTLLLNEGYGQHISPPELISQKQTSLGVEQTWKMPFKVPSVLGLWSGYRIDFSDAANNSVQFILKDHSPCLNSKRYKYPNQAAGSLDSVPCIFTLDLNVTTEVASEIAKVTNPHLEEAKSNLSQSKAALLEILRKLQNLPVNKNNTNFEKSYKYFLEYTPDELSPGMEVIMLMPMQTKQLEAMSAQIQGLTNKLKNQFIIDSKKPLSIVCIKSGKKKVVTGLSPKCPSGFKISK